MASDPAASYRWCTEASGLRVNESGRPVTESGEEIHFLRSLQPGKTYNFVGGGEIRNMAFAMFAIKGITRIHRIMRDEGLKVTYHIQDRGGLGRQFQICDPDGNKWDIWELQMMIHWNQDTADSENWKDRYFCRNCYGKFSVDEFFEMLKDHTLREPIGAVQLMNYNKLRASDPGGVQRLLESLDQFCEQNPDLAFEVLLREGGHDSIQSYVYREYEASIANIDPEGAFAT